MAYKVFSGLLAIIVGFVIYWNWMEYWLDTRPTQQAQKVWDNTTAHVTNTSRILGSNLNEAYREANLTYADRKGNVHTITHVQMPPDTQVGRAEPIVVHRHDGRIWIKNNLQEYSNNPRDNPYVSDEQLVGMGFLAGGAVGCLTSVVLFAVLLGIARLVKAIWHGLTKPVLMQIVWRKLRQLSRRFWDAIRLRLEFHRRRKRLRPSPAYKSIRRFQAELLRMDPTPKVIAARRKANELLTRVIERDNQRVEVIDSTIDAIREDVELDHQARKEANKELESA